jgi:hypothetical protein
MYTQRTILVRVADDLNALFHPTGPMLPVRVCDATSAHVSGMSPLFSDEARADAHIVSTVDTSLHTAAPRTRIAPSRFARWSTA